MISGADTPPFDLPLPPPPSSPPSLSANASAFAPTSSLLNQARDVLYPNNPQGPRLGQHSSNFEHNFKNGVTHSQSSEHQYTQQQKQQQITIKCASIDVPRPLTNDLWVFLFQTIDVECVKSASLDGTYVHVKAFKINVNKCLKPFFLEQHIDIVNRVTLQSFW